MINLNKIIVFEWDHGNLDKSYQKHGVVPSEAEEVFLNENILISKDVEHSKQEDRFEAIGQTFEGVPLFLVFTVRRDKIRIISARKANKKERRQYEQKS